MRGKYERTDATRRLQSEQARNRPKVPIEDRFWSKVRKGSNDECWLWGGACERSGYGKVYAGRSASGALAFIKTHRLSWELANGRALGPGENVLHSCDNPPCVNPTHLRVGSHAENARDRETRTRGRDVRGEASAVAKLTENQVREIIKELGKVPRRSQTAIGRQFGISQPQVSKIMLRQAWAHLWEEE